MTVKKISEPFGERGTAAIMQTAINEAESHGEFLKKIVLSPALRESERVGDDGFLLIFDSAQEAEAHD